MKAQGAFFGGLAMARRSLIAGAVAGALAGAVASLLVVFCLRGHPAQELPAAEAAGRVVAADDDEEAARAAIVCVAGTKLDAPDSLLAAVKRRLLAKGLRGRQGMSNGELYDVMRRQQEIAGEECWDLGIKADTFVGLSYRKEWPKAPRHLATGHPLPKVRGGEHPS
jgi:hypothetical protein